MLPAIILFFSTYVLMLTFSKYRPYIALLSGVIFIATGMLLAVYLCGKWSKRFGITEDEEESLRSLVGALRQRVDDQRENIVSLQEARARQDELHAKHIADVRESCKERLADYSAQLERERGRVDTLQREIRRIRVINTAVAITIAVVAVGALYVVIDALNGGWGLIRYQ